MKLAYEAIDADGQVVSSTIQATNVASGVEELRRQGMFVTQINAAADDAAALRSQRTEDQQLADVHLPLGQLMLFTRQMSMLLTSGSAVVPALLSIAKQMKNPQHRKMARFIKDELEQGHSLTDALRKFPKSFSASYCAVVAAGESSATLPQMFARLAAIIGKRRAMRNSILGALIYPLLLTLLSIKILLVMLLFVVPRFAVLFTTLRVDLPATTKTMMHAAVALRQYWFPALILAAAACFGVYVIVGSERGRQAVSDLQIRIPLLGRLLSRLIQAQTFRVLGMLLEARVGLLEALELARRVTKNSAFQQLFAKLDESVTRGDSISAAMEHGSLISPSIVQAIRIGEQSGRLGESISYVADVLDEENAELLTVATRLIEPMVLLAMGLAVGSIAVSLFLPLFDLTAVL